MKKFVSFVLCIVIAFTFAVSLSGCGKSYEASINVYNWGEYIDQTVLKDFEEQYNIEVNYTTYESNEAMYTKVISGAADYDIVIPSDYMISKMIEEDLLAELNFDNIPNYKYIDETHKNLEFDPDNKYSVPYTWGTTVILYNDKYVAEEDVAQQSIELLWNEKYEDRILMFDNPRDAFGLALKKLGYSMNTTDEAQWKQAGQELEKQFPLVSAYVMDQIFDKMTSEEAYIAPYYAGDWLTINEMNENVKAYIPKEGANLFVDSMCVLKSSKNKDAAEKFINFMCDTEVAVKNAEAIGYATPHTAAREALDLSLTGNALIYPDTQTLADTEVFVNLPQETLNLQSELWMNLKIEE